MDYTFTEKKRIRKDFGKRPPILDVPFLLSMQIDSYRDFLQEERKEKLNIKGQQINIDHILDLIQEGTEGELVNMDITDKGKVK